MKNINSKSFKQYQGNTGKRAVSPLLANANPPSFSNPKSAKKKTAIINSPYQRAIKQFQSYGKAERKKISNYVDAELSNQKHNKFRIVTEPVDDRIMHLAQSIKNPKRIQSEIRNSTNQMQLNLKQTQHNSQSRSRQRIYTNPTNPYRNEQNSGQKSQKNRIKNRELPHGTSLKCRNCLKYSQQFEYLNNQIKQIIKSKQLWKSGEITYQQVQQLYRNMLTINNSRHSSNYHNASLQKCENIQDSNAGKIPNLVTRLSSGSTGSRKYQSYTYTHNSLQNLHKFSSNPSNISKYADSILAQIKTNMMDLILQVQSLATIDYPKMLQMQILKYQPSYSDYIDVQQTELKELFGQLRMTLEGKTIDYDMFDSESENNYTKMIIKNMKSRLNAALRENLELRICKAIYEKSQEISEESQQYLRKVIEDVLVDYVAKRGCKERQKQRQRESNKQKDKGGKGYRR